MLATSLVDGFVEFMPNAQNLSSILAKHSNDILQYFNRAPGKEDVQGIAGTDPQVRRAVGGGGQDPKTPSASARRNAGSSPYTSFGTATLLT